MRGMNWTVFAVMIPFFWLAGCGDPPSALDETRKTLRGLPSYSIVLDDMKTEGDIFETHWHKYKVITEQGPVSMDWARVPKKTYEQNRSLLGMTIWTKQDGRESAAAGPPGYEYVDNPRYGRWRSDSSGSSFWVFYGQYRLLGDLLGAGPIYRNHYAAYSAGRARGVPYYGPNKEYGRDGSLTRRRNPNFYQRAAQRRKASRASFGDKFNRRIGRTRAGFSGRSGIGGK
ncbi:conserved exported hypothetical protein [Candidatus Desulfarcum epimagneticum]|uniref:Lipoprotein n=1 Tax=uncultured Desulfobacteraceae bacterium TaxID=218296 RepID=A0A484HIV4_9BACT|nr:conserved exported hypothetical protein [uncultured Desulfobacteraceae bacterium]